MTRAATGARTQRENFKPGINEPRKVESDTDGDGNVDSVRETSGQ